MSLDTLVATTNKILRLDQPTLGDLLDACEVGCRELRLLADDDTFYAHLRRTKARPKALQGEIRRVFEDLREFNHFIEEEARALKEAGVGPRAVADLLGEARRLRQRIQDQQVDADRIRAGISQLRDATCAMAEHLARREASTERREGIRKLLRRVALGVGGATIVVADVAAEVSLGLYAHASMEVGAGLIVATFVDQ